MVGFPLQKEIPFDNQFLGSMLVFRGVYKNGQISQPQTYQ